MRVSLSPVAWRWLLLTLCCLSLISSSYGRWTSGHWGDPGFTTPNRLVTALTVEPNSPAARAGLRTGDIIDLRVLSPQARYLWNEAVVAGETLEVPVRSANGIRIVRVVAARAPPMPMEFWFAYAGFLWMVLFAAILAWRRADNREARVLALLMILLPGLFPLWDAWYSPWVPANLAANAVGAFQLFGDVLLVTYAMLFPLPRDVVRRLVACLAYAIASASTAGALALEAGYWFGSSAAIGFADRISAVLLSSPLAPVCLVALLCLLLTVVGLKGAERSRVAWVAVSLGPMYALEFVVWGLAGLTGNVNVPLRDLLDVSIFLAPVGLWISLLNRRLFDIGFALNRAAVFTGVSVVIVGVFVLAEWALSAWFSSASHTTNLAISAVLALALGLSVRAIHTRVDRVLDTLFFRKRHEDEQAIRMLAREAAYITESDVLLSRMVATLEERADASSVHVLLGDGVGRYGGVSANDPAIVRLQATRQPLDLRDVTTAVAGEFAYPMLARGRLVGALTLGLKRSGEAYAPDESDAIAQLAHDAGAAFDVLSRKSDRSPESLHAIRERLDLIVEMLADQGVAPELKGLR